MFPVVYLGPPKPDPELVRPPFCPAVHCDYEAAVLSHSREAVHPQGIVSAAAYASGALGKRAG